MLKSWKWNTVMWPQIYVYQITKLISNIKIISSLLFLSHLILVLLIISDQLDTLWNYFEWTNRLLDNVQLNLCFPFNQAGWDYRWQLVTFFKQQTEDINGKRLNCEAGNADRIIGHFVLQLLSCRVISQIVWYNAASSGIVEQFI